MQNESLPQFLSAHPWIIVLAIIWTLPWKGVALWKAARKMDLAWFIAILVLNTLGILEIIYIFLFSKKKEAEITSEEKIEIIKKVP